MKLSQLIPLVVVVNLAAAEPQWKHLSTANGDLPMPWEATEQTAAVVGDFDGDGVNGFVIASRKVAPAVIWYRRTAGGWDRFVIEPEMIRVEAGGAVYDIDGDGDTDLVFGGDGTSNELWWWENPSPNFDPTRPWKRRLIKQGGGKAHHDQAFADFKGTGKPQLAFWNQQVKRLFIADIPANPRETSPWPFAEILDANLVDTTNKQEGMHVCDVDGDGRPDLLAGMWWFKHVKGNEFKPIQVTDRPGRIAGGKFKPGKTAQIVLTPGDLNGPVRFYECVGDPENPADWRARELLDREMIHGHTLEVADIDGDGNLDIFAAEMAKWGRAEKIENPTATAWIWYGDGRGNFRRTVFQQGFGFHEGRIADLNGDGLTDVLSKPYTWEAPRVDVWLQQPATRPAHIATLETSFRHSVHTYFGISPWNRAGTHLLYLGFDDPGAEASVVVRELRTGRDTTLAKTRKFTFHNAGSQHWALNDTAVVFSTLGDDGRAYPAVVTLNAPHRVRVLKHLPGRTVRHVETDTVHVLAYWATGHPDAAIERINLKTEKVDTLVTVREALAELPADLRDPKATEHFFTHPVTNRAGTRMFFKIMKAFPDGTYAFGAFYTRDMRSGKIRCFGNRISGHPYWLEDDRHILNIESTRDDTDNRWLVRVDADSGTVERVFKRRIEGPGHPSQSPDGRWIVTDAFTRDGRESIIYLGDLKTGGVREIARLDHKFGGGRGIGHLITRGQPHPAWSPDGRQIVINCNQSGERMRLLLLEDFLPAVSRANSQ